MYENPIIVPFLKKSSNCNNLLFEKSYSADFTHFLNMIEINTDRFILVSRSKILKAYIGLAIY